VKRKPGGKRRFKQSPRSRGYDAAWDKLSLRYRTAVKGMCEECARRGHVAACDVVDHMIPVRDDPSRRLDPSNLDALCNLHHNGFKRRIEKYARATGDVHMLPLWMKYPETRPAHFRIVKAEASIIDGVAINQPVMAETRTAETALFPVPAEMLEVFSGVGSVISFTNASNTSVELFDGDRPILIMADGQALKMPIKIKNGLSVIASTPGKGKISLAYVEGEEETGT
jgi:hypothetical protein